MKVKGFLRDFLIIFAIALIITTIVTFLYNLLIHGEGFVDWATSFRLAITLGIFFPTISLIEQKHKK